MTDLQTIDLFFKRDSDGIAEISRRYGRRLMRIAEGFLPKEDAEECVNDLYLALWNHIPPDKPEHLFSYMTVILKNKARERWSALRTSKRSAELVELSDALSECIPDPSKNTEEEAILLVSDSLNTFLKNQPPIRREMFILRYWYGKSIKEIARHCGRSQGTVEKTLYRMKTSFKKFLME